jgi:RNA polymerase sigma factor (sigma-70 family)
MVTPVSSVNDSPPAGATDAGLVRACAAGDRTEAFGELVRRHGRTVLAVCRGVLGDGADADDAFQATFLVLLRRARAIRQPEAVGGWLCGVAARVARRVRQRRTNTWANGGAMATNTPADPPTPNAQDPAAVALDRESQAAVWDALGDLPDKYRRPLVLCHFDDLTTEQAAAVLRCPVGTLRSRLVKGRDLLRARLVRRGVTVTAAALIALLLAGRAAATPPPELVRRTTSAAEGGASPVVTRLADRTTRDLATRRRLPVVVAVGLVAVITLVAVVFGLTRPAPTPPPPEDAVSAVRPPSGPGTLLVVSQQDATVSLIDPRTGRTRAVIATDPCPHEVSVSPNGRLAAVASYGLPFGREFGGTVTLIDVAAGRELRTVTVGRGFAPHGTWWQSDDRVFCTAERAEAVVEIDAARGTVVRTLPTNESGTHSVAGAGDRAFTANVHSGTVSALDLRRGVALTHRRVGRGPEGLAVSPDGSRVWVGNRADDTITVLAADDLRVIDTLPAPGNLKQLKLSTMLAEHDHLAREATGRNESEDAFLLRLTELEVAARTANATAIPVVKELDAFDFTATPSVPRQTVLELARGGWVDRRSNCCLIGGSGTGKTHLATAIGLSLCRLGKKVRFVTAAGQVTELEEAHQQHRLDRTLTALGRLDLLVVDELGYLSFSRSRAELLFQGLADRYERGSLLITTNLPFGEWGTVFQGERMTAALHARLTHQCDILELTGESYRVRESMQAKQAQAGRTTKPAKAKK